MDPQTGTPLEGLGVHISALPVEPGWYLFLADPLMVADPELIIQAIHAVPGLRGPLVLVAPGHLAHLSETEARRLWRTLCMHFGTEPEREA